MTQHIDLLELAALVLAAEQLELPGTPPRDMSKYRRKSAYEALLDNPEPGQEDAYEELQQAYEEHIDSVVTFLDSQLSRFKGREWDEDYVNDYITPSNEDVLTTLDRWAAGRRFETVRKIENAVEEGVISDEMFSDIVREHVRVYDSRLGVVLNRYEDEGTDEYTDEDVLRNQRDEERFDELLEGLDDDDIEEVERRFNAQSSNCSLDIKVRGPTVKFTAEVPYSNTYYICVDFDDLTEALLQHIEDNGGSVEDGGQTNHEFALDPTKYLPEGLTGNQLALLRIFDIKGVDEIKSSDLKGLPIANVPWVSKLLKTHKILTPEIVKTAERPATASQALRELPRFQKIQFSKFPLRLQIIWDDKQNWEFIIGLPAESFSLVFGFEMPADVAEYVKECRSEHRHPAINAKTLTVGWFRFTVFDRDIWIDEVQTDLDDAKPGKLGAPSVARFKEAFKDELGPYLFETFIREMRARGYQRFFMPNFETKRDTYPGTAPPAYLYNDVPKAMRFRTEEFKDTGLETPEPAPPVTVGRVWHVDKESADSGAHGYYGSYFVELMNGTTQEDTVRIAWDSETNKHLKPRSCGAQLPEDVGAALMAPADIPPWVVEQALTFFQNDWERQHSTVPPSSKVLVLSSTAVDTLTAMADLLVQFKS